MNEQRRFLDWLPTARTGTLPQLTTMLAQAARDPLLHGAELLVELVGGVGRPSDHSDMGIEHLGIEDFGIWPTELDPRVSSAQLGCGGVSHAQTPQYLERDSTSYF